VHLAEDQAMSAAAPRQRPARVTLTLTDGRQSTRTRESHRGDFQEPFAESEIRDKYRELAGEVLTEEGVKAVEDAIDRADEWRNVAELADLLRRHGRS
jgi:2-methylcitrate dehydratase PrpD